MNRPGTDAGGVSEPGLVVVLGINAAEKRFLHKFHFHPTPMVVERLAIIGKVYAYCGESGLSRGRATEAELRCKL